MKAILEMEKMGFRFTLKDSTIRFTHEGERPEPDEVRSHLAYLRRHRGQAVHFLRGRAEVSTPAWVGERVRLEELLDFKEKWGLRAVASEWPRGERCPRLYLVEDAPESRVGAAPLSEGSGVAEAGIGALKEERTGAR